MTRCISLVPIPRSTAGWARCTLAAKPRDVLCSAHRDALDGAVMGVFLHAEPRHVSKAEIAAGGLQTDAAFAGKSAHVILGIPARIPSNWKRKKRRNRREKAGAKILESEARTLGA